MTTEVKEQFIKIPTDFESLHDLKELVSNYEFVTKLSNALLGYQRAYIDSYLMTMEEVLDCIPEEQHSNYKIISGDNIEDLSIYRLQYIKQRELVVRIRKKCGERIFIVDFVNKTVSIAKWAIIPFCYENNSLEYIINEDKILIVTIKYSFTACQQVGGSKIQPGGYYIGGTQVEYIRNGNYKYQFCTKTNRFLGLESSYIDPVRGHKKTNGY